MENIKPKWFIFLEKALLKYHITINNAATKNATLLVLLKKDNEFIDLEIKDFNDKSPYFIKTKRFVVTYCGIKNINKTQEIIIKIFSDILKNIEDKLPEKLELTSTSNKKSGNLSFNQNINRKYFFCTVEKSKISNDIEIHEAMVRLTPKCNQKCPFCSAEPIYREPEYKEIIDCFNFLSNNLNNVMITITGGEPTLNKNYFDYINFLVSLKKINAIQIQTNGVIFKNKDILKKIPNSNKLHFFVSFHAAYEKIYNNCTGTNNQFSDAVKGINNILKSGLPVILNIVICNLNINHIIDYIKMIPRLFINLDFLTLHFSTLICTEYNKKSSDYLVRYSDISKKLNEIYKTAENNKINLSSFLNSTHASIPTCLLNKKFIKPKFTSIDFNEEEVGYEDYTKRWIKLNCCKECNYNKNCIGLPLEYALKFGFDEISVI